MTAAPSSMAGVDEAAASPGTASVKIVIRKLGDNASSAVKEATAKAQAAQAAAKDAAKGNSK